MFPIAFLMRDRILNPIREHAYVRAQIPVALREQLMVDFLLAEKLTLDRRNFLAQVEQRIADHHAAEEEIDAQVLELRELAAAQLELPAQRRRHSAWLQGVLAAAVVLLAAGVFVGPRLLPRPAVAVAKAASASSGRLFSRLKCAATTWRSPACRLAARIWAAVSLLRWP